jgi:putative membrane protein
MNRKNAFLLAAALAVSPAFAAPTDADKAFVTEAAADGAAEVALGRTASKQAGDPKVKKFGEQMVKDHSKANDELKKLAKAQGIDAPSAPTADQKAEHQKLQKLKGAEFDEAYIRLMREDHDKAVALFKKQSEGGGDDSLKQFASKTLPTLQMHRKMLDDMPSAGTSGKKRGK